MAEEFRAKAAYLGGHPGAVKARIGELALDADELRWMPKVGFDGDRDLVGAASRLIRRRPNEPEPFTIDVSRINSVEFKGDPDLKKSPSGYVKALPLVAHGYGGGQAKHPMGTGKLKKLLIVRYTDQEGRDHEVVFANVPSEGFGMIGPLAQNSSDRGGYELVSKIMAARAKSTPSHKEDPIPPPAHPADRLRALAELHGEGLLTDEEFAAKRQELLDAL